MKRTINKILYNPNYQFNHEPNEKCKFPASSEKKYAGWHKDCEECILAAKRLNYTPDYPLRPIKKRSRSEAKNSTPTVSENEEDIEVNDL